MRCAMIMATQSYNTNAMTTIETGGDVFVEVKTDMSVFGTNTEQRKMMGVIFDSMFSRFRAEGRYGEMTVSFANGSTWQRDTY